MNKNPERLRKINLLLLFLLLKIRIRKNKVKRPRARRFWVRPIFLNRKQQGSYYNLLQEMQLSDQEKYFNYLRMSSDTFHQLLNIVESRVTKLYCVREPVSAGERLTLTLRFLASGESMMSISYAFRIAHNTVSKIIKETCEAIWYCLNEDVLLTPSKEAWFKIAQDFENKWQLPHCVGAIDGKHVVIQGLPNSGSTFYNYKGTHSIVLMALCDAEYKFTLVDIGCEGRHSDGGIFKNSIMGKRITSNNMNFPPPSPLGSDGQPMNYYIAADEAFPLSTCIMRPYPGRFLPQLKRIYNYRLCRGRRVIENAFGILTARWRIYRRAIIASEATVVGIVKATVCLHNFLMNQERSRYFTPTIADRENEIGEIMEGEWRNEETLNLLSVHRTSTNMYGRVAEAMRHKLATYFVNEGSVPFQWNRM